MCDVARVRAPRSAHAADCRRVHPPALQRSGSRRVALLRRHARLPRRRARRDPGPAGPSPRRRPGRAADPRAVRHGSGCGEDRRCSRCEVWRCNRCGECWRCSRRGEVWRCSRCEVWRCSRCGEGRRCNRCRECRRCNQRGEVRRCSRCGEGWRCGRCGEGRRCSRCGEGRRCGRWGRSRVISCSGSRLRGRAPRGPPPIDRDVRRQSWAGPVPRGIDPCRSTHDRSGLLRDRDRARRSPGPC